jgi:hypothetical protein
MKVIAAVYTRLRQRPGRGAGALMNFARNFVMNGA